MVFKHKLSCRLALIRDAVFLVASAGAFASCEVPAAGPTGSSLIVQVIVVPESTSLDPAQHVKFVAYGRTPSGDSAAVNVIWNATGGSIASDGTFAADTAAGDFLVTGTDSSLSITASSRVRIRPRPVASVTVTPASASSAVGQTFQLAAIPRDASGNILTGRFVTWASSNTAVATVTGGGAATGLATGSATITATSEGKSGTAAITVTQTPAVVASVAVSPGSAGVTTGQTVQLTATPRDASGNALTGRAVMWGTSNASMAPVSSNGLVTGIAAGLATITATSDGKSGTSAITVTLAPVPVASVTVSPASASVTAGQTVQLTATPRDASGNALSGRVVTWGSGNTAVATVSGVGLVAGATAGPATITATSEGKSGTTAITVTPVPVASVTVSPVAASVTAGQTVQLTATPRDASGNALTGRVVTWGSGALGIATVSGTGLVSGMTAGGATITATSEGKSGSSAITVMAPSGGGGTVLFQETFEDNSFGSRSWYDNTSMTTTTAQHIPGSTRALEIRFTPGSTTPTWGGAARHLFNGSTSVYLSYWVKYSANWVGSGKNYHPHEFMFITNENDQWVGPSVTHLTTYVEHVYQNGGVPVLAMQDGSNVDQSRIGVDLTNITENRGASGCNGNTDGYATGCFILGSQYANEKKFTASQAYFTPTAGPGYKGDWHLVEAYFQLNSIVGGKGVPDGIARYWFDGQLVINKSNLLLRTGAHSSMKFNQFLIGPYIGDGSPADQTMWVDDLTVATAKP